MIAYERIQKNLHFYIDFCTKDSQREFGLQFIDNICSVIRLELSENDKIGYYSFICDKVKRV